jgi:dCTP deaminase
MVDTQSLSYASQDIRKAIKDGAISVPNFNEHKIQPSSFEPQIGTEAYIIDSEYNGIFRIAKDETVYENLFKLPSRQRRRVDIHGGFELRKGFSYLIPLEETIKLGKHQHIKSSPKSSLGRLFLNTRLLGDYNPSFDELNSVYCVDKKINMWLYVQPLAFNVVIYPGLSLNQIRIFNGYNARLSPVEIIETVEENPILFTLNADDEEVVSEQLVTDGLVIHLNLAGRTTQGVVGMRARHNPMPIDLTKKSFYEIESYFEPVEKQERIFIKRGEYYLLSSKEILKVPESLSIELRDYSKVGFLGPLHFAGFIDNGFEGDLVYEIRSDELSKELELTHNMPISKLDFFKTAPPDKIYGKANNNYQYQVGTKPAKYFKNIDYKYLARKYKLLDRDVLTADRNILMNYRGEPTGFEKMSSEEFNQLTDEFKDAYFQSRYTCETDPLAVQVVPYVLIKNREGKLLKYQKPSDPNTYAEERLFDKHSVGIGCHIIKSDLDDFAYNSLKRELNEKGVRVDLDGSKLKFLGTVVSDREPVDRSHFGLVYQLEVEEIQFNNDSPIKEWEMLEPEEIEIEEHDFESWSREILMSQV